MLLTYIYNRIQMSKKSKRKKRNKRKKMKNIHAQNQRKIDLSTGPDYWETDVECITDCSKAPENIVVWIHPLAKEKIEALMEEYTSIEWLAYLLGKFDENIEVTDIFIPEQEISTASVDNVVCKEFNDLPVIGVIHSHHSMGNSFSHTDDKYINQNHDISLCISKDGINGHVRWETPCGSYKIVDSIVKVKTESVLNKKDFINNAKEKIKKKSYTTINYGNYPYSTWDNRPSKFIDRQVPRNLSISKILTEDDEKEIESQIKEINFSEERTIEEEINLMEEMEKISTDFDGPEVKFI